MSQQGNDGGGSRPGSPELTQDRHLSQPWYRMPGDPHPFSLVKKISSNAPDSPTYRTVSCFPWDKNSLSALWQGSLDLEENRGSWKKMVSKYWDAVAVGADHRVYIFFTHSERNPICVSLPKEPQEKLIAADTMCVAWALSHHALFEPLIIFSRGSLLHIHNLERRGIAGYLRGHGGAITSIAVHPTTPNLFCTTSRDTSTRIYDLKLPPQLYPKNPHWPPGKKPSMAGAAHGLHMTEAEGSGIGRCIIVLMGGRSGGHMAAVLGAAFHPHLPLIATCGMDRHVKIWVVRPTSSEHITREDKPLFSSGRIHKARVLSVTWLQHDLLLTHSAAAIMRVDPENPDKKATYLEPGQLTVWRWLGFNRFFPPDMDDLNQSVLRGCASDYQESSSFKFISIYAYPPVSDQYIAPHVHVYHSATHDPLILSTFPDSSSFLISNAAHFRPRSRPLFSVVPDQLFVPPENEGGDIASLGGSALVGDTERMHLAEGNVQAGQSSEAEEFSFVPPDGPTQITGWEVGTGRDASLQSTAMACGGRTIVSVGSKGALWVWRMKDAGA